MSFAKATVVGFLGGDPETRYLESGTMVVSFSIAADGRKRGNDKSTTWFRISAFGEQADRLASMIEKGYIAKGKMLYVEGQLESREYTANDGTVRTSLDVNLSDWQFIGSGEKQGGTTQQGQQGGNVSNLADFYGEPDTDMNEVPF